MKGKLNQKHISDVDGTPAGGVSTGIGIDIRWQNGPLGRPPNRVEPNGAFVQTVIEAAIGRLEYYQASKFRCRENALAITKLQEAQMWLDKRTRDREEQNVEGTHGLRASEG